MRRLIVPMLSLVAVIGCQAEKEEAAPAATISEADASLALEIYTEQGCAVCHGDRADGNDLGPALRDLAPYFDEARLATYLKDPDAFVAANADFDARREQSYDMPMPAYDGLELFDRRLLARWLLTR